MMAQSHVIFFLPGFNHTCRRSFWIVLSTVLVSSCGDSPVQPDPTGPTITCPANVEAVAHNGQPAQVTFQTPTATGGSAPVTTACAPASGSAFPIGSTTVGCTATDRRGRTATCSFAVTVMAVPVLSSVKFVAFGDSITDGTTSPDPTTLLLSRADSYPTKLEELLKGRYVDQMVTVLNQGRAGERVNPNGMQRFPTVLDAARPEVVLLLEGANDLLAAASTGGFAAITRIITALEEMIKAADARGVDVMLATFPPQNPAGSRGGGAPAVPTLNAEIAKLAARRGATLVDLFNGLGGTPAGTIGVDGLHPTATGYTKIANIWFEAIKQRYERAPAATGMSPRLVIESARH